KAVARIEHGGISIGNLDVTTQELGRDFTPSGQVMTFVQQLYGLTSPDGPVSEEATHESSLDLNTVSLEPKRSQEIHQDIIVVAGVESYVIAPTLDDGPHHVQRLIAVEGSNLDGPHAIDFQE